ncbi:MAG: signal peptidase I [Anaerolineae bacterium]|nr:signal peptidase I [Anaerolineae bacterium]
MATFEESRQQGFAGDNSPVIPPEEVERVAPPTSVVVREIIETLLLTLFIFWLVNTATGRYRVQGHSMMPTLEEGEYLIINKLSYYLSEPQRGDIVVLHYPRDRTKEYIKRVIGLPGDRVEIANGQVRVNGVVLDEPYLAANPIYGTQSWTVPADSYFVMGDNRNNSSDSRDWSFLPRSDIVGKAAVIYWGIDDWGLVPHYAHSAG